MLSAADRESPLVAPGNDSRGSAASCSSAASQNGEAGQEVEGVSGSSETVDDLPRLYIR